MKLKTSKEWKELPEFNHITIMDPDGWDRKNYDYSFNVEKITLEEFNKRLIQCTCMFKRKK